MDNINAISILKKEVEDLGLPTINTIEYLNNNEPVIYLCGKSTTGKTTFLNALFNMDKDELFTSTNISTKTEFRFQFDEEENIINSDGKVINLPSGVTERKELLKSLNKKGDKYIIFLNQKSLLGRTIVDIPGVFDFSRNNDYSNQMIDEADIIYYFTQCTKKIEPYEYQLLKSISDAGIPIIILFTMGDITEVDEGITRITIPNLVEARLDTCFHEISIFHHQIISSNDFYKGKDTHGIDKLQVHISGYDFNYKKIAEENRLRRTVMYYIVLLNNRLIELNDDSETFIGLVHKKNQLWYETENKKVIGDRDKTMSSISSELNWLSQNCEDSIYGKSYNKIYLKQNLSIKEQKEKFQSIWNEFWVQFTNEFNFLQVRIPRLPELEEALFEQISIDKDKLKELVGKYSTSDSDNKNEKRKDDKKKSKGKTSKKMTLQDLIEIGINMSNANIIIAKWKYIISINDIIKNNRNDFIQQCETEFDARINNLGTEKNQRIEDEMLEDTAGEKINSYNNALLNLKSMILNDIQTS